jgi:Flp pilus assembly pilin Flp
MNDLTNTTPSTNLWRDERAANAIEYALVAGIIAIGLIVAFVAFRGQISDLFNRMGGKLDDEAR